MASPDKPLQKPLKKGLWKYKPQELFLEFYGILSPRGGGHLGIFWVGMCRPGLQIGIPF